MPQPLADSCSSYVSTSAGQTDFMMLAVTTKRPLVVCGEELL
jgi:hypothetical protein